MSRAKRRRMKTKSAEQCLSAVRRACVRSDGARLAGTPWIACYFVRRNGYGEITAGEKEREMGKTQSKETKALLLRAHANGFRVNDIVCTRRYSIRNERFFFFFNPFLSHDTSDLSVKFQILCRTHESSLTLHCGVTVV